MCLPATRAGQAPGLRGRVRCLFRSSLSPIWRSRVHGELRSAVEGLRLWLFSSSPTTHRPQMSGGAMPPMLPSPRPAVIVHGNRLLPAQRGCGGICGYRAGSSRKWVPRANAVPAPCAYARRMRTDRGRRTFYAAGWVISAGVMAVTFRMWQLHVREVEQRAEDAERTRDEAARRCRSGCGSPVSCTIP